MPRLRSLSQLLLFVVAALIVSTGIPLAHSQTLASTCFVFRVGFGLLRGAGCER